jgi:methionyl-tRNA formyltransferase
MSMLEHRLRDRLEAIEKTTKIISVLSSIKNLRETANKEGTENMSESQSDVSVVTHFILNISKNCTNRFKFGFFNYHMSEWTKYRHQKTFPYFACL